jgi:hypothetical protein
LLARRERFALVHDVVAVEDAARLVPGEGLRDEGMGMTVEEVDYKINIDVRKLDQHRQARRLGPLALFRQRDSQRRPDARRGFWHALAIEAGLKDHVWRAEGLLSRRTIHEQRVGEELLLETSGHFDEF